MESGIAIRKAMEEEKSILLTVWLEKVQWLSEQNMPMWDPSQFTIERLKEKYGEPEYFVCKKGKEIIGGFIVIEYDERYWKDNKDKAFYFHKFVVRNGHTGKGYSGLILNWVKEYGKKMGKEYIRLDFEEERTYLKNIYYSHGFKPIEKIIDTTGHAITKAEYKIH